MNRKKMINNIFKFSVSCNYINKLSTHSISLKIWSQFEADIWIKSVGTHQQRVTRKSDTKNVKCGKRKWIHILEADAVQEKEPLRWCSKAEAANDSRWFQCQLWLSYMILYSWPRTAGKKGKYFWIFPNLVTIFGLQLMKCTLTKKMTAVGDDKEGCRWHLILFKLERRIPDSEQDTKLVLLATADFRF